MKILLTLLALLTLLLADGGTKKVVYNLTTSDVSTFEKKILKGIVANKTHYESTLDELDVAVVIHGGAYRFFVKDLDKTVYKDDAKLQKVYAELKKRIKSMAETYDVEFLMCGVGMKKNGLTKKTVVDFVEVVPNASIGLIDKQNEGYAYIGVGD
jgi:uncharacterized protein